MKARPIAVALLALLAPATAAMAQQSAREIILSAAAAEAMATFKQGQLHYTVGDKTLTYEIRRQLPDRVHVRIETEGQEQETIVIGTTSYFRTPEGWQTMTLVAMPGGPIALAELLGERYRNIEEAPAVQGADGIQRRFVGEIDWQPAAGLTNTGALTVFIGQADQRLRALHFEGQCSGAPCAFQYAIDYAEVPVEAPQ